MGEASTFCVSQHSAPTSLASSTPGQLHTGHPALHLGGEDQGVGASTGSLHHTVLGAPQAGHSLGSQLGTPLPVVQAQAPVLPPAPREHLCSTPASHALHCRRHGAGLAGCPVQQAWVGVCTTGGCTLSRLENEDPQSRPHGTVEGSAGCCVHKRHPFQVIPQTNELWTCGALHIWRHVPSAGLYQPIYAKQAAASQLETSCWTCLQDGLQGGTGHRQLEGGATSALGSQQDTPWVLHTSLPRDGQRMPTSCCHVSDVHILQTDDCTRLGLIGGAAVAELAIVIDAPGTDLAIPAASAANSTQLQAGGGSPLLIAEQSLATPAWTRASIKQAPHKHRTA